MPVMEADFGFSGDWSEVQASVPIFTKNEYLIKIKKIRGQAWEKRDDDGNGTGVITQVIKLRPEMVGVYDSNGKVQEKQDGKKIAGLDCEEVALWVHSEGGRKMAKKTIMAVLGYVTNDPEVEKGFNAWLKQTKADLSTKVEEDDDGKLSLVLGSSWEELFVNKEVRSFMDEEQGESRSGEPFVAQNYVRFSPVKK